MIAIVHPWLLSGGSEARVMWSAQALQDQYDITIVTAKLESLRLLNSQYGTNVDETKVSVIQTGIPIWLRSNRYGDALRGAWFQRSLRNILTCFDLVISAYNLVDAPVPVIQFIADFSWDDAERRRLHPEKGWKGFIHGNNPVRSLYLAAVHKLGGDVSAKQVLNNSWKIISNSRFSAEILKERYDVESDVIYPPVAGKFPIIPWHKKQSRFVALGRISPEKKLEKVVRILEEVRKLGHEVELDILGNWENSEYGKQFYLWARKKGRWIVFHGDCRGEKKTQLLTQARYGLHGCTGEAFGIAVAEMIKAGCLPFVPGEGGPVEIVEDKRLVYTSQGAAVGKIAAVLESDTLQKMLHSHVINRQSAFSAERFMNKLRKLASKR